MREVEREPYLLDIQYPINTVFAQKIMAGLLSRVYRQDQNKQTIFLLSPFLPPH